MAREWGRGAVLVAGLAILLSPAPGPAVEGDAGTYQIVGACDPLADVLADLRETRAEQVLFEGLSTSVGIVVTVRSDARTWTAILTVGDRGCIVGDNSSDEPAGEAL